MKLRPGNTSATRSKQPLIGGSRSMMRVRSSNDSIHHFHRDGILGPEAVKEYPEFLLDALSGTSRLMAGLLYGSGMRLMECVRLRVKDMDFAQKQIIVRDGKG